MKGKSVIAFAALLLVSACSNTSNERSIASDREKEKLNKNHDKVRGAGWTKFQYDNYRAQPGLAAKAFGNVKNLRYASALSKRRQTLFEENLLDTGVDKDSGIDCSKMEKMVQKPL